MKASSKKIQFVLQLKKEPKEANLNYTENINLELRTPLTLILTPLKSILGSINDEELKSQISNIYHNASNLLSQVNQMIDCRNLELCGEVRHLGWGIIDPLSSNILMPTKADEKLIQKAIESVERNLNNPNYSVEQLSSEMNMDRTGLYRKLVNITGQTPTAFIRSIRLTYAAYLLLQHEYTIAEIAERVGFSQTSTFSRCFQEEFGVRPSQYAQHHLRQLSPAF